MNRKRNPRQPREQIHTRRDNHAADRTRSPRWRSGSRRNKRLRNTPTRAGDYPAGWLAFYHCDGTFSHAEPDPRHP